MSQKPCLRNQIITGKYLTKTSEVNLSLSAEICSNNQERNQFYRSNMESFVSGGSVGGGVRWK